MPITHREKCGPCANGQPSDASVQIGEEVHIDGGDAGDTDHKFLQCQNCGSVFVRIRDIGGRGGNGTFYQLLTKGLF